MVVEVGNQRHIVAWWLQGDDQEEDFDKPALYAVHRVKVSWVVRKIL